jgi:hypothetical protein
LKTFDFNLDKVNFEIFPNYIWQDCNVVFHGTSEYHSQNIERIGFIPATSPFDLNDAIELVRVLQLPEILQFDQSNNLGMTVSRSLNNYICGIKSNDLRLSFAYLSYQCIFFSEGQSKGGQVFGYVRKAKSIIQQAIQAIQAVQEIISEPIKRLFDLETNVANANGVVYAVKLQAPYDGIKVENGIIHSTESISANNIIGKVILPNYINMNEFTKKAVNQKNHQKLVKIGHLGIILNRMNLNDDDQR